MIRFINFLFLDQIDCNDVTDLTVDDYDEFDYSRSTDKTNFIEELEIKKAFIENKMNKNENNKNKYTEEYKKLIKKIKQVKKTHLKSNNNISPWFIVLFVCSLLTVLSLIISLIKWCFCK